MVTIDFILGLDALGREVTETRDYRIATLVNAQPSAESSEIERKVRPGTSEDGSANKPYAAVVGSAAAYAVKLHILAKDVNNLPLSVPMSDDRVFVASCTRSAAGGWTDEIFAVDATHVSGPEYRAELSPRLPGARNQEQHPMRLGCPLGV